MKVLMVMYDSLRRDLLSVYGGPIPASNFERLAAHTVCFDKSYVGSLPCMPARRELHTGRYNFLHRSWGPMEPYDDSMPEILKKHGIRTHTLKKISEDPNEIPEALRQGHIAYVINTRTPGADEKDGITIRQISTEYNVNIFTSLDTVKVLLDVLEDTTLRISTIDA